MARPTTKPDLMHMGNEQFDKIWALLGAMTEEEQNAEFHFGHSPSQKEAHWDRDKNIRDVLVHLYEWHQLLLNWVNSNQNGTPTSFLPAPYNWRSYGQMNVEFWTKHQATPLSQSINLLKESHENVFKMIEHFSNDELFAKGSFPWTGSSPLGSYCVSATSSHYDWALKKLKLHHRTYQEGRSK